ncbi:MarR family winged helix-turn-helix transcriptional regulator [Jatrophihabitans sp. DSM 45814]
MPTKTMPDDSLALERQVCFALAVANRSVLAVYRPLLEPMGLTHPQYLVMLALWGETPMTVKDLASALQLDPATLSPLLKRLEAAALVTRTRNEADERQLRIELTPAGKRLRSRAEQIPAQVVEKLDVTIAELETLHQVLTRINKAAVASGLKRDDWT